MRFKAHARLKTWSGITAISTLIDVVPERPARGKLRDRFLFVIQSCQLLHVGRLARHIQVLFPYLASETAGVPVSSSFPLVLKERREITQRFCARNVRSFFFPPL